MAQRESKAIDPTRYWANAPRSEIAAEVKARWNDYEQFVERSGYAERIRASYNSYYGIGVEGSLKLKKKDGGAETMGSINHHRNLVKNTHILVTQNKLAYYARSINSDAKSQMQASTANGLLGYYNDEKNLGLTLRRCVEVGLICSEGFVEAPWNESKGYDVRPDEMGNIFKSGDQDYFVRNPFNLARDASASNGGTWYIVRENRNKWDLAALYPELAEYIIAQSVEEASFCTWGDQFAYDSTSANQDDLCTTYRLYHDKTPAVPEGRESLIVGDQWLLDGPLQYKRPPIYRFSAGDMFNSICAHSISFDLLPIQQAFDLLLSAVLSNNMNFAKQNIWSPDPNLDMKAVTEGFHLFTSSIKPETLQLTNSSPETLKVLDLLLGQAQVISAINNTVRGNPESSLKSGNALALMLATAIQFVSELQESYASLAGDVGTQTIENLQLRAKVPFLAAIGGKAKRSYMKEFTSSDIKDITRVSVETGNPVSQTAAGRYSLAELWLDKGLITNPDEFMTVVETGNTDGLTEKGFRESVQIRRENELLLEGINPPVMIIDDHRKHILEHREVSSDPSAREDPGVMAATMEHIQTHIDQWLQMPPELKAIIEGQPLPPPGPPGAPGGGNNQIPEVAGVNIPQTPPGTPPEAQAAYEQVSQNVAEMAPPQVA